MSVDTSYPLALLDDDGDVVNRAGEKILPGLDPAALDSIEAARVAGDNAVTALVTTEVSDRQAAMAEIAADVVDEAAARVADVSALTTAVAGKAPIVHSQDASTITNFSSAADARITAQKGVANGVVPLGADVKVASVYLPSYVDDIVEYANLGAFPATGESGKIYVAINNPGGSPPVPSVEYRWSGTTYSVMTSSPGSTDAVPEGAANKYYTDARANTAADARIASARGVTIQAADPDLTAIAGLVSAADKMPYATGASAWALTTISDAARDVIAANNKAAMRASLGVRIGVDVQPQSDNLDELAVVIPGDTGLELLGAATVLEAQTLLDTPAPPFVGNLAQASAAFAADPTLSRTYYVLNEDGSVTTYGAIDGDLQQTSPNTNVGLARPIPEARITTAFPFLSTGVNFTAVPGLAIVNEFAYTGPVIFRAEIPFAFGWTAMSTKFMGYGIQIVNTANKDVLTHIDFIPGNIGGAWFPTCIVEAMVAPSDFNLVDTWRVRVALRQTDAAITQATINAGTYGSTALAALPGTVLPRPAKFSMRAA